MASVLSANAGDGIAVVSINRPHRHNALDDEASDALRHALVSASADPSVRAIVLRGEGPSFCSGRDLAQLGGRPEGQSDDQFVRMHQLIARERMALAKPLIAAVHGAVLGGGLEIALHADVRIGTPDASLGLPEVHHGLVTDTGGSVLLTALVGPGRAKIMVAAGRRIDGTTAHAWGLLDELVPRDQLDDAALRLAAEFAARPPFAVQLGKRLVNAAWAAAVDDGLEREALAQVLLFSSADYAEASRARAAGRTPIWTGR
jgi:enoyl-CoA hydratase/carnithine racemase